MSLGKSWAVVFEKEYEPEMCIHHLGADSYLDNPVLSYVCRSSSNAKELKVGTWDPVNESVIRRIFSLYCDKFAVRQV